MFVIPQFKKKKTRVIASSLLKPLSPLVRIRGVSVAGEGCFSACPAHSPASAEFMRPSLTKHQSL